MYKILNILKVKYVILTLRLYILLGYNEVYDDDDDDDDDDEHYIP